jgi:hypothetical protein|eukprot:COSAG02_NODE_902_length_16052_cov_55.614743_10_plen_64_part_00
MAVQLPPFSQHSCFGATFRVVGTVSRLFKRLRLPRVEVELEVGHRTRMLWLTDTFWHVQGVVS